MIFFKIFEDKWKQPDSYISELNDYLKANPNVKVISYQVFTSHGFRHGGLENVYTSENLYPINKIIVQFEGEESKTQRIPNTRYLRR